MMAGITHILFQSLLLSAQPAAAHCATGDEAAAQLLATHEAARQAHLLGKAELLASGTADALVSASNGNVAVESRDAVIAFFGRYFATVKYLEWSDAAPPVVRVSPDGRLGWMAVKLNARYVERAKPEAGEKSFRSSWIATYERAGCAWRMTGISSNVVDG